MHWQTFIPLPSSLLLLLPLICSPSHLSTLSASLLLFPISSAQMRCCAQRRVLILSSCPDIRWGKWACNETENTAMQTCTHRVCRYFCACQNADMSYYMSVYVSAFWFVLLDFLSSAFFSLLHNVFTKYIAHIIKLCLYKCKFTDKRADTSCLLFHQHGRPHSTMLDVPSLLHSLHFY